jgi:hypothetical protein
MLHYECWTHRGGQKYLVRLDTANLVTGVCGPMVRLDVAHANFANYNYDSQPQHTAWVQQNRTEFHSTGTAA